MALWMISISLLIASLAIAEDKPKYDLPRELQSLPESARPVPARTILDFDSVSAAIADTAKAVVWLKFKPNSDGGIGDVSIVFSSHSGFGLEDRAITALKTVEFDPLQMFRKRLAKNLYYEVLFDHALYDSLTHVAQEPEKGPDEAIFEDTAVIGESTEDFPLPDEFIAIEVFPEMIEYAQPDYPISAKHGGVTGTVWVKSLVDRRGNVRKVMVGRSSGSTELDNSAIKAGYKCRFSPALQNGQPIACWVTYRVEFMLED